MSTFSGINTALSSLIAQRQALEVSGQNIANAKTVGYTRQRANLTAIEALSTPSMYSSHATTGNGTAVSGISRLGDAFLDARLRTETGSAAYLATRANTYSKLESTVGEPGKTGLSSQLGRMWSDWSTLSLTPDSDSARSVLLEDSQSVADRLATLYTSAATEWRQSRTDLESMVSTVNTTAASVANLNDRILAITNSGGSANELMDQRDQLVTSLSELTGATARTRDNGVVDVLIGGNALVEGARVNGITLAGAATFETAVGGAAVQVVWASQPTVQVPLSSGKIAGVLSVLAPADGSGTGGLLVEAGVSYNAVATKLATSVNALHNGGTDLNGNTTGDFFALDATQPAALGLSIAVTTTGGIAATSGTAGAYDGTLADKIGQLKSATNGPDTAWSTFVVQLGVSSKSATSRAAVAESSRATAEGLQLSQISVDTDEETVNMLAYQRAYEGAARVLTAIDEMLDTLINRTGTVGR